MVKSLTLSFSKISATDICCPTKVLVLCAMTSITSSCLCRFPCSPSNHGRCMHACAFHLLHWSLDALLLTAASNFYTSITHCLALGELPVPFSLFTIMNVCCCYYFLQSVCIWISCNKKRLWQLCQVRYKYTEECGPYSFGMLKCCLVATPTLLAFLTDRLTDWLTWELRSP